jgi:hypothetical protein
MTLDDAEDLRLQSDHPGSHFLRVYMQQKTIKQGPNPGRNGFRIA